MKNLVLILSFLLGIILQSYGTAQIPDKIIYKGRTYKLHSNPLDKYFERYPEKKPKRGIISTALWRGYVATFEVKREEVYLKDVKIEIRNKDSEKQFDTKWISVKDQIIPQGTGIKIDWLNEILILPYGKMVNYVHLGYGSTYSKYILLEVENGTVNRIKKINHEGFVEFKHRQFQEFKKSEKYIEIVEQMKKEQDYDDEFIEAFLKNYIIGFTKKFLD